MTVRINIAEVRLFEWYGSDWICGGCGHEFASGLRIWSSKSALAERRQWVREKWKDVPRLRDAISKMVESF